MPDVQMSRKQRNNCYRANPSVMLSAEEKKKNEKKKKKQ